MGVGAAGWRGRPVTVAVALYVSRRGSRAVARVSASWPHTSAVGAGK